MTNPILIPDGSDPFFAIPADGTWNACIGLQGDEENYIDGYVEAALELASTVLEKDLFASRDTLVLPILYNARHGIELTLKFAIKYLFASQSVQATSVFNHKIGDHFHLLVDATIGDAEIRSLLARLGPYVKSLAAIDDDGQQLRYAQDTAGKNSLQDTSLANIEVIRNSLVELKSLLGKLKYRVMDFRVEQNSGTFTSECSRKDLQEIAQLLPPKSAWSGPKFTETKQAVMSHYDLSSGKFSDAVDVIKKSRELGALIGLEFQLAHLTDTHAHFVFEQWSRAHPPRPPVDELQHHCLVDANRLIALADRGLRRALIQSLLDALTSEELADLETVFYLGRDGDYPEQYERFLELTKRKHAVEGRPFNTVHHIFVKTNLLKCFARGVRRLGRPRLADNLLNMRPDIRDA